MSIDHLVIEKELIKEEPDVVYLPPFYFSEAGVAKRLKEIMFGECEKQVIDSEQVISLLESKENIIYDDIQRHAIREASKSKVMVLQGGQVQERPQQPMVLSPSLKNQLKNVKKNVSNNLSENSIRPFTIGRKSWLFSGSPKGAASSAGVYTLIEATKANGLNPTKYIEFILEDIPGSAFVEYPEFLEDYILWNSMIQKFCK